jgi:hypothetical protein
VFKAISKKSVYSVFGITELKRASLCVVLWLLLLFIQSIDLVHHHDDNLQTRYDCELCVKINSLDDMVLSDGFSLSAVKVRHTFETTTQSLTFFVAPAQKARAPPIHA